MFRASAPHGPWPGRSRVPHREARPTSCASRASDPGRSAASRLPHRLFRHVGDRSERCTDPGGTRGALKGDAPAARERGERGGRRARGREPEGSTAAIHDGCRQRAWRPLAPGRCAKGSAGKTPSPTCRVTDARRLAERPRRDRVPLIDGEADGPLHLHAILPGPRDRRADTDHALPPPGEPATGHGCLWIGSTQ